MWQKVIWLGTELWAYVYSPEITTILRKSGTLKPGQIWAEISEDGPLRPVTPVS